MSLSPSHSGNKAGAPLSIIMQELVAQGQASGGAHREQTPLKTTSANGGANRLPWGFDSWHLAWQDTCPETTLPVCSSPTPTCKVARGEVVLMWPITNDQWLPQIQVRELSNRWSSVTLEKFEIRQVVAGFNPCAGIFTNTG